MDSAVRAYLMYFVVPLWIAAGFGDWLCHRASDIHRTGGSKESFLHLLMLGEMGLPVLLVLFFEVNATVIAFMLAAIVIHEATTWWDVSYAASRRHISPVEQHIHSLLEVLPLTAFSLLVVNHWEDFLSLFNFLDEPPFDGLYWKTNPLPMGYCVGLIVAMLLFGAIPFVEELVRGLRWERQHGLPHFASPRVT
jgi:hypothetical protein